MMNIEIFVNSVKNKEIERYHFLAKILEHKFLIKLSKKMYAPLCRVNNINMIKKLIILCNKELLLKNNSPKKIEDMKKEKYLNLYFFLLISYTIYNELFIVYMEVLIKDHIENYNFDFNDFFTNNINRSWLFPSIKNKKKIENSL